MPLTLITNIFGNKRSVIWWTINLFLFLSKYFVKLSKICTVHTYVDLLSTAQWSKGVTKPKMTFRHFWLLPSMKWLENNRICYFGSFFLPRSTLEIWWFRLTYQFSNNLCSKIRQIQWYADQLFTIIHTNHMIVYEYLSLENNLSQNYILDLTRTSSNTTGKWSIFE